MKNYTVISYYTKGTSYEKEVKILIESLNKFNIPHDIRGVPALGSWQKNTMYKATFISSMIEEHAPMPVVWMDADSVLLRPPEFLSMIDADAAFYFRTNGGRVPRIPEQSELISATMYFKSNESTKRLLSMWIAENERDTRDLEQHNLQKILPIWRDTGGVMAILPQTYCKIFDSSPDFDVVVQNQASRRFRAEVGG